MIGHDGWRVRLCVPHTQLRLLYWVFFDLFALRASDVLSGPCGPRVIPGAVLSASWPSSVVPRRGHAPHVLHQRGGPPCLHPQGAALPRSNSVAVQRAWCRTCQARSASAPLYAHICLLRRKRLRTAGRRNPRTLPVSRPMTNSPSSASSARSASACCRCSARRWPCELLPTRAPLRCMSYWRPL